MAKLPGPQARMAIALERLAEQQTLQPGSEESTTAPELAPLLQAITDLQVRVARLEGRDPTAPLVPEPVLVTGGRMPLAGEIGQPDAISPDGIAVPGVVPGFRTAAGVPLVDALQVAATNAARQAIMEGAGRPVQPLTTDQEAQQFTDLQVSKIAKQGRGDGKDRQ